MRYTFVANTPTEFIDPDFDVSRLAELEAMLVLLTRELSRRGRSVEIYGKSAIEGMFHGIRYRNLSRFDTTIRPDVLVMVGAAWESFPEVRSRLKVFWYTGEEGNCHRLEPLILSKANRVLCTSVLQQELLQRECPLILPERLVVTGMGIATQDYFKEDYNILPNKDGKTIIVCVRQNENQARLFSRLSKIISSVCECRFVVVPSVRYHAARQLEPFTSEELVNRFPGSVFLSGATRPELVRFQKLACAMISAEGLQGTSNHFALECVASGTPPVLPDDPSVRTILGDSAILVNANPGEIDFEHRFLSIVIKLLQGDSWREGLARKGRLRAYQENRIDLIADHFEAALGPPVPAVSTRSKTSGTSGTPAIGVIIPVHNQAKSLYSTVTSVIPQLRAVDELIVIDDASTDKDLFELLSPFNARILWVHNKVRAGVSHARNRGIERSSADWIKFLDADDILAPFALDIIRNSFSQLPSFIHVVAGGYHRIRNGRYYDYRNEGLARFGNIYRENPLPASAAFVKRDALIAVGMFDERIDFEEDWDLWLRLHELYGEDAFGIVQTPVCYIRDSHAEKHQRPRRYTVEGVPVRDYFHMKYGIHSQE